MAAWTDEEDETLFSFGSLVDGERVDVDLLAWMLDRSEDEVYERISFHLRDLARAIGQGWERPKVRQLGPARSPARLERDPESDRKLMKLGHFAAERRIQIRKYEPGRPDLGPRRNVVAVGPGSPFANPFTVEMIHKPAKTKNKNVAEAVMLYQRWVRGDDWKKIEANLIHDATEIWSTLEERREALILEMPRLYRCLDSGGSVGCFCRTDDYCHGDVLVALWKEHWTPTTSLEACLREDMR